MPGRNFLEYWSCKALSRAFVTSHCDIIATLFFFLTYQEVLDLSTKYASLRSYVLWQCARDKKGLYTAQLSNLSCKLLVSVNQHICLYWYNTVIIIIIIVVVIDIIYSSLSCGGIEHPQLPSTSLCLDPLFWPCTTQVGICQVLQDAFAPSDSWSAIFLCALWVPAYYVACHVPHPTLVYNQGYNTVQPILGYITHSSS